jgi:hypothetical protein
MSWVNDLAAAAGVPAGAATLAVAMYAACTAAEKAARPEALEEIGRILKDPSWSSSVRPSAVIQRLFVWTFGERQLSWRCLCASVAASIVFDCAFALILRDQWNTIFWLQATYSIGSRWFFDLILRLSLLPDYFALAKSRYIMVGIGSSKNAVQVVLLVLLDVAGSITISFLFLFAFLLAGNAYNLSHWIVNDWLAIVEQISSRFIGLQETPNGFNLVQLTILSTVLTSIWTILILLSTTALKLLGPVHRFTAWYFDVEKHPVQAIGIVAGALVMIGSLIWALVRAVF